MDDELEEIKRKKMMEMMRQGAQKEEKSSISDPVTLTDQTFAKAVAENPLIVIDCWAAWCGPCRIISPIIDEMARDYAGKVVFGKLNVDENPITAAKYGIMSIPTLLIAKNGRVVDQTVGAVPRQHIEGRLKKFLDTSK